MAIRIVIVDSHKLVLAGLTSFIDVFDDLELVGSAEDGETGLAVCSETQPDVLITEIRMPNVDGITLTQRITQYYPRIKVIALDIIQQPDAIEAILRAGAAMYLTKDSGIDELAAAIREVTRSKRFPPPYARMG